jgi:tripartite-type tricarboxylate transporter receptor subunit TctC
VRKALYTTSIGISCLMAVATTSVSAQNYPNRPIRIITSEPGGSGDLNARVIAQGLSGVLGQPVVVENRSSVMAIEAVARGTADGYTLLTQGSAVWIGPQMQKMPYDPVRDFSPITLTTSSPSVLVTHPSVPVKTVRELIALAKARPGELNYAAATLGSSNHFAGELFKSLAGVNITAIPYKSASASLNDVIAGRVQLTFASAATVAPHIKTNRLTAVALSSAEPSALFPGLASIAASGVPGYEWVSRQGIWGPAKMPASIVRRLNQEIVRIYSSAEVTERLLNIGAEPAACSPEQFSAVIKADISRIRKLIESTGIKVDAGACSSCARSVTGPLAR